MQGVGSKSPFEVLRDTIQAELDIFLEYRILCQEYHIDISKYKKMIDRVNVAYSRIGRKLRGCFNNVQTTIECYRELQKVKGDKKSKRRGQVFVVASIARRVLNVIQFEGSRLIALASNKEVSKESIEGHVFTKESLEEKLEKMTPPQGWSGLVPSDQTDDGKYNEYSRFSKFPCIHGYIYVRGQVSGRLAVQRVRGECRENCNRHNWNMIQQRTRKAYREFMDEQKNLERESFLGYVHRSNIFEECMEHFNKIVQRYSRDPAITRVLAIELYKKFPKKGLIAAFNAIKSAGCIKELKLFLDEISLENISNEQALSLLDIDSILKDPGVECKDFKDNFMKLVTKVTKDFACIPNMKLFFTARPSEPLKNYILSLLATGTLEKGRYGRALALAREISDESMRFNITMRIRRKMGPESYNKLDKAFANLRS